MAFRALIVDDREPIRQQLMAATVTNGFEVVGQSATAHSLDRLARKLEPDIIFLDLHLPGNALDQVRKLAEQCPSVLVVATSTFTDVDLMQRSFDAGVHRCLRKPLRVDEIHRVLENIADELRAAAGA